MKTSLSVALQISWFWDTTYRCCVWSNLKLRLNSWESPAPSRHELLPRFVGEGTVNLTYHRFCPLLAGEGVGFSYSCLRSQERGGGAFVYWNVMFLCHFSKVIDLQGRGQSVELWGMERLVDYLCNKYVNGGYLSTGDAQYPAWSWGISPSYHPGVRMPYTGGRKTGISPGSGCW